MEYQKAENKWVQIALVNLCVVALLGVVLRYKIAYPLPQVHQKHFLHAHSHFAFTGWISQILMTFLAGIVAQRNHRHIFSKYRWILAGNVVLAYGMLISFALQGYGGFSITFSALSVVNTYLFGVLLWRDMKRTTDQPISFRYFRAAIVWNVVASIGTYALAYLMVQRSLHQNGYLAALYFFLHFQYNGWFIFAALGIFMEVLSRNGVPLKHSGFIYTALTLALVPAYFLSTLWAPLPQWLYGLVVIAALIQLGAWCGLLGQLIWQKIKLRTAFSIPVLWLIRISGMALTLKFLLQALSTIPALGQFAFGIRPIVVAYLHLVMLLTVSVFLMAYGFHQRAIPGSRLAHAGAVIFTASILLNECLLMLQGISMISPAHFGVTNDLLFLVSLVMLTGTALLAAAAVRGKQTSRAPDLGEG